MIQKNPMTRVLIVEDDPFIALDLAQQIGAAGFEVVGPASRVVEALDLVDRIGCDVAVLDVNLGQETSEAVAKALSACGVSFLAVSGYAADQHPEIFRSAPQLTKPVEFDVLLSELRRLTDAAAVYRGAHARKTHR